MKPTLKRADMRTNFLPWDDVMSFGFGVLRLSSNEFWSMTPKELDASIRGVFGPPSSSRSLARGDLMRLMRAYPDQPKQE